MKVFKFGGASIKNAHAIRNMCKILQDHQDEPLIVIVSAMGKSTNALEIIHQTAIAGHSCKELIQEFITFHQDISYELFEDRQFIDSQIERWTTYLNEMLSNNSSASSEMYDSIVATGELLSSTIISQYLNQCGIDVLWTDARKLIQTDAAFQEANVDWDQTKNNITAYIDKQDRQQIILTQGFIAGTSRGQTTTLGREGSDFTGAIFASCLKAESFTVWKDVAGILNADPKRIPDAILFDELSYNEASEMTYYGAKVIHPKTIKPLANQNIPLFVRCFDQPESRGTKIHDCQIKHATSVIVFKENQCLVSFRSKDLTFVNEKGISIIFDMLHELSIDMNIMQNSAVSFSICIDYNKGKIDRLIESLKVHFDILYNSNLELVTIKNYSEQAINKYLPDGEILLEQRSRNNYRVLLGH